MENKKGSKKGSPTLRLMGCLLDREPHKFAEFYDWVMGSPTEESCLKIYNKQVKKDKGLTQEEKIVEGRRKIAVKVLCNGKLEGYFDITYPEGHRGKSNVDAKECIVQLTEVGYKHIMESKSGTFCIVFTEILQGLKENKISMNVSYLGMNLENSDSENKEEMDYASI